MGKSDGYLWNANINGLPKGSCTLTRIICKCLLVLMTDKVSWTKQIVHNKSNLKMDLGANLCQKKVLFTKVKARHLGEAIISSCTICNCNSNEMVCKTCKKNLPAIMVSSSCRFLVSNIYHCAYCDAFVSSQI